MNTSVCFSIMHVCCSTSDFFCRVLVHTVVQCRLTQVLTIIMSLKAGFESQTVAVITIAIRLRSTATYHARLLPIFQLSIFRRSRVVLCSIVSVCKRNLISAFFSYKSSLFNNIFSIIISAKWTEWIAEILFYTMCFVCVCVHSGPVNNSSKTV